MPKIVHRHFFQHSHPLGTFCQDENMATRKCIKVVFIAYPGNSFIGYHYQEYISYDINFWKKIPQCFIYDFITYWRLLQVWLSESYFYFQRIKKSFQLFTSLIALTWKQLRNMKRTWCCVKTEGWINNGEGKTSTRNVEGWYTWNMHGGSFWKRYRVVHGRLSVQLPVCTR